MSDRAGAGDTIRRAREAVSYEFGNLNADQKNLLTALADLAESVPVLLAEMQQDKQEIERLRDRAVCSGCGNDVGESGICTYGNCDEGEMIPASELPFALMTLCDRVVEDRAEWRSDWEALRAEAKGLAAEPSPLHSIRAMPGRQWVDKPYRQVKGERAAELYDQHKRGAKR